MGRGELPFPRWAELVLRAVLLVPVRFVSGMLLLVAYYLVCLACTLFVVDGVAEGRPRLEGWRRVAVVRSGRALARAMLFVFGFYRIRVTDRSSPNAEAEESVSRLPLVGLISKCLGCIFVQRESKASDSKGVSEGTTTNGDYLLPFKTGAFLARVPVQPVILRYPYMMFSPAWDSMDGVPNDMSQGEVLSKFLIDLEDSFSDRALVWHTGFVETIGVTFRARHVFLLLCQFVNYIEVVRLPVYYPSEQKKEDPKLYANNVRKLIATEGNLILSNLSLAEKRVYHAALNGNNSAIHQKDD